METNHIAWSFLGRRRKTLHPQARADQLGAVERFKNKTKKQKQNLLPMKEGQEKENLFTNTLEFYHSKKDKKFFL